MSRNASGTYTLPAGNPVINGTTITSTWANSTLSDLGTEMTDSLDRSGKGGMLAQLKAFDGSSGAPGVSWANELDSGIYRVGSKDFKFQVNAVTLQEWTATVVNFPLGITATGAGSSPGVTITGADGVYALVASGTGAGTAVRGIGGATGNGGSFLGGATSGIALVAGAGSAATAPFALVAQSAPTGLNVLGSMYVTSAGKLMICTVTGTPGTFVVVGTQT